MRSSAIPRSVAAVLSWWLPRARGLCGGEFASAVLFGSVAHGDFLPRWSDVDVCLVLHEEPRDDLRAAVDRLARESVERFVGGGADGWESGQAVEGPAIPRAAAADPTHPALDPFDRLSLARAGVVLDGEPIVFAPPPAAALAASRRAQLASFLDFEGRSPIRLASQIAWLARDRVFVRTGEPATKTAALESEIARGGPFTDAFLLALALRREGSAACAAHEPDLRRLYAAVARELEKSLKRSGRPRSSPSGGGPW